MRNYTNEIDILMNSITALHEAMVKKLKADEMVWQILTIIKDSFLIKSIRNDYRYNHRLNLANAGEIMNLAEQFVNKSPEANFKNWL